MLSSDSSGGFDMENDVEANWLIEVFLRHQSEIDRVRRMYSDRNWLKDALDSDRAKRQTGFDSASSLDAL
jgi:hypothetical protein